jgi:hypothetical protein
VGFMVGLMSVMSLLVLQGIRSLILWSPPITNAWEQLMAMVG